MMWLRTSFASPRSDSRARPTERSGSACSTAPRSVLARSTTSQELSCVARLKTSSPLERASATVSAWAATPRLPSSASASRRPPSSPRCFTRACLMRLSWSLAASPTSSPLVSAAATASVLRLLPRARASGMRLRRSFSTGRSCKAPSQARTCPLCSRRRGSRPSSRSSRAFTKSHLRAERHPALSSCKPASTEVGLVVAPRTDSVAPRPV
mmetsp:Transcript_1087/g.2482  ORF Transcript_1087/g.2482 Transcript_1087/m.2482 type:complete len:211 (-) Transcript_1087:590-1222(-)